MYQLISSHGRGNIYWNFSCLWKPACLKVLVQERGEGGIEKSDGHFWENTQTVRWSTPQALSKRSPSLRSAICSSLDLSPSWHSLPSVSWWFSFFLFLGPGAVSGATSEISNWKVPYISSQSWVIWVIFALTPDLNPFALPPVVQQEPGSLQP